MVKSKNYSKRRSPSRKNRKSPIRKLFSRKLGRYQTNCKSYKTEKGCNKNFDCNFNKRSKKCGMKKRVNESEIPESYKVDLCNYLFKKNKIKCLDSKLGQKLNCGYDFSKKVCRKNIAPPPMMNLPKLEVPKKKRKSMKVLRKEWDARKSALAKQLEEARYNLKPVSEIPPPPPKYTGVPSIKELQEARAKLKSVQAFAFSHRKRKSPSRKSRKSRRSLGRPRKSIRKSTRRPRKSIRKSTRRPRKSVRRSRKSTRRPRKSVRRSHKSTRRSRK